MLRTFIIVNSTEHRPWLNFKTSIRYSLRHKTHIGINTDLSDCNHTTVLSLMCVDALNTTTGNSFCKYLIHRSRFSFGIKSRRKKKTTTVKHSSTFQMRQPICHQAWVMQALNCKLTSTFIYLFIFYLFCSRAKAVSCCRPSAAQLLPAVDTCSREDHERRGLLSQRLKHQWPEKKEGLEESFFFFFLFSRLMLTLVLIPCLIHYRDASSSSCRWQTVFLSVFWPHSVETRQQVE